MADEDVKGRWGPQERFEARLPRQEEDVARLSREVRTGSADPADLAEALSRLGATLAFFKRTADELPLKVQEVASTDWLRYAPPLATALSHLAEVRLAEHDERAAVLLAQESLEAWRKAHPDPTIYADDVTEAEAFVERVRGR